MHDVRVDSVTGLVIPNHPMPELAVKYYLARTADHIREAMAEGATSLVAELENKRIIGALQMRMDRAKEAYLMLLYVRTVHHRMGVGSHLITMAESIAEESGAESMALLSTQLSVPFYETHRYKNLGEGELPTTFNMHKHLGKKDI
jgi:predicted N-acetyltransferase YhbS